MANEYLRRNFTSTGNLREGTFSFWMKGRPFDTNQTRPVYLYDGSNLFQVFFERTTGTNPGQIVVYGAGADIRYKGIYRDPSAWSHYLIKVDNTINGAEARFEVFVNGVRLEIVGSQSTTSAVYPTRDANVFNNVFYINGTGNGAFQVCDYFYVDGQALTPDVFGFYKTGKGYISAGSTVATDFRPGQWVPKSPRIIIADINSRGGFGVNGFYLPMNDSNNFGADFHCTPNSIIKLQENLPQPKSRIDGVENYTGALRDDPFKQYLIFAQPNVSGGLQNGYGDYSHIIRGSGSPCTLTGGNQGTPAISTNQSTFYGSSLYFDGNDTLNVETNNSNYLGQDFTIEFWVWHDSSYPINQMAFNTTPHTSFGISLNRGGSGQTALFIGNGSNWQLTDFRSGGRLYSQQWNHVVVERYNNTITIYHNGIGQGSFKAGETVVTNSGTFTGVMPTGYTSLFRYGTYENNAGEPVVGYIQDYRIYSGVAKYKGGFDVPKPYTPVGIATWRAVPDTTANNFATWNPLLGPQTSALADGNLTVTSDGANFHKGTRSNIGVTSGKWYWEYRVGTVVTNSYVGVSNRMSADGLVGGGDYLLHGTNGNNFWSPSGSFSVTNAAFTTGMIIGVAFDYNNGTMDVYKDGTLAVRVTGGNFGGLSYHAHISFNAAVSDGWEGNFGQNPTFSGNTTAGTFTDSNGKGLFKYQPPAGFLALCEDNLPTPAISDPGKHFKTVLYTGDGTGGRSITGVGFQPDLVWTKERNIAYDHGLYDSVRGPTKGLSSNNTAVEYTEPGSVVSFDTNGFSIGSWAGENNSGSPIVAWCWKAGNTTTTNTNGSITSTVSVNQQAGFSIVSWTGNGASTVTVGHGLGKTPAFMILKARDAGSADSSWVIFHKSMGSGTFDKYMYFNTGGAGTLVPSLPANSNIFTSSNPGINSNNIRYITYCWAEIEGYSKFGSYVGNGDFDGPFVYCGFKPAWVMIKSLTNENGWIIMDNARKPINPNGEVLFANDAMAEQTDLSYRQTDFLSNGFKIRAGIGSERNSSGTTYIFVAFAESPFQTANAK